MIADGTEEVRLTLPAVPEYARIVRLTAAGLASRLGFTYDDVEDLRIAVGEACSHLLGDQGHAGTLAVTYTLDPDSIKIEAVGEFADSSDGAIPALSEQILGAVVDSHELDSRRVLLVKHRSS